MNNKTKMKKKKKKNMPAGWGVAQVVEHLSSKHKSMRP
jgi:hypothetical protein